MDDSISPKQKRGRGRPRKTKSSNTTAITTSTTLKDVSPIEISKTNKKKFLQQKIAALQRLDYDEIIKRFAPVLEVVKNGGTLRQSAFAGGMSLPELQLLLDFGRFGGSDGWFSFYEEFYRAKSAHEIEIMKDLRVQAKLGDKWAIERLMNIMWPEDFGAFDVGGSLPPTPANASVDVHVHIKDHYKPEEVIDAEMIEDAS